MRDTTRTLILRLLQESEGPLDSSTMADRMARQHGHHITPVAVRYAICRMRRQGAPIVSVLGYRYVKDPNSV